MTKEQFFAVLDLCFEAWTGMRHEDAARLEAAAWGKDIGVPAEWLHEWIASKEDE